MADNIELIPTQRTFQCCAIEALSDQLPDEHMGQIINRGIKRLRKKMAAKPYQLVITNNEGPYSA